MKRGVLRRVVQRVPQPLDGRVQAMLEIDERVARPQLGLQLLAGDQEAPGRATRNSSSRRGCSAMATRSPFRRQVPGVAVEHELAERHA